jgi:hypothetical protein
VDYDVVYDVAADGWLPAHVRGLQFPLILLPLSVVAMFVLSRWRQAWEKVHGPSRSRSNSYRRDRLVFTGIVSLIWAFFAADVWSGYKEQARCRAWLAQGEAEVVEGPIRNMRIERAGNRKYDYKCFEVGRTTFLFGWALRDYGGFKGSFTSAPERWELADSEVVRITHRERRILRIERVKVANGS